MLLLLLTLIGLVVAASIPPSIPHETLEVIPDGWKLHSTAEDSQTIALQISILHHHTDYLDIAQDVSNPESANYGNYLGAEELEASLPDYQRSAAEVVSWLNNHAISKTTLDGDWLHFETTVGQAKELLGADFKYYQHGSDDPVLRTRKYDIPIHLRDAVDFIYPTTHFMRPKWPAKMHLLPRQHIPTGPVTCATSICPKNLTAKYNITHVPADSNSGSQLGIGGFLEQYPDHKDVQQFLKDYGLRHHDKPYKYKVTLVDGGKDPNILAKSGAEALLDVEYGMAIADSLPVTYFSTGGRPAKTLSQPGNKVVPRNESGNEPWIAFLQHILKMKSPPQVLSLSYTDDEQDVPLPYARKVCSLCAQLASRGVSVIVASGDGGSAGTTTKECKGPNGKLRFIPTFPASCPWVTTVGATNDYGVAHYSSGGFSNYFARPKWQDKAVSGYRTLLNGSHKAWYDKTGRAYPDVALAGSGYLIAGGGATYQQKRTSASTPVFAAMVALLNDKRLRAGKPVLGFLNPLLYKNEGMFRDVTEGESDGCEVGSEVEVGFGASKGWDAASGLGEPDFAKLLKVLT
ncbi:tripeptidyl-peptidase-like protein 4 [Elsinoe australis]|uniref:tripeptidyl-peptidase II n=1 Tax=Elsinoe australis TaxID=40998 RepID=A0A4U7AQR6_9PEZI|nr:tripeptidyl-peptidase-like protein 4 [Elsinoe australis]